MLGDFNARVGKRESLAPSATTYCQCSRRAYVQRAKYRLDIKELCNGIPSSLRTAAAETFEFRQGLKKSWYDENCRAAGERKWSIYHVTFVSTTTRTGWDRY